MDTIFNQELASWRERLAREKRAQRPGHLTAHPLQLPRNTTYRSTKVPQHVEHTAAMGNSGFGRKTTDWSSRGADGRAATAEDVVGAYPSRASSRSSASFPGDSADMWGYFGDHQPLTASIFLKLAHRKQLTERVSHSIPQQRSSRERLEGGRSAAFTRAANPCSWSGALYASSREW